jgi:hypothetical protein
LSARVSTGLSLHSVIQSYLLVLRTTGAEVDAEDEGDEDGGEDDDATDRAELSFGIDAKLPYVFVQLAGKPPGNANGTATVPFIQYGIVKVLGRRDGRPLGDGPLTMRGGYYSGVFRNRVCNPARKPPHTHKARRGGASLVFDEGATTVTPLGGVRSEEDIEALAGQVAALVAG